MQLRNMYNISYIYLFYIFLPKATTKGVKMSKCLKLIPYISSPGMALRNISAHKYATAFSVTNRTVENGG